MKNALENEEQKVSNEYDIKLREENGHVAKQLTMLKLLIRKGLLDESDLEWFWEESNVVLGHLVETSKLFGLVMFFDLNPKEDKDILGGVLDDLLGEYGWDSWEAGIERVEEAVQYIKPIQDISENFDKRVAKLKELVSKVSG
jgi:hypothetical protein